MATINFEPVDYDKISKARKLALFLIIIGPEQAAEILKQFDDQELENICREIASVKIMDEEMQELILKEFAHLIGSSYHSIIGGMPFAQIALEKTKGSYKAANMLGRIGPMEDATDMLEIIADMEARQIYNLVRNEQGQTIAFVLSNVSTSKAAEIISFLSAEQREDVIEKIGELESISLEVMRKVIHSMKAHVSPDQEGGQHKSGGVHTAADVMNQLDKETSKAILAKIEEKSPMLGSKIRKNMFSFDDLSKISISDMQRIAREVEMSDLVLAMKSASPAMQDMIYKSVSKRAAETLKEEIELLGSVRLKDVEAAQDRIIYVVRRLEEEGEITIDQGGEDRVIN